MDILESIPNNKDGTHSVSSEKTEQIQWKKETNTGPHLKEMLQQFSCSVYKCGICGKSYTDKKKRNHCKYNHKKNRKKREKGTLNLAGEKDKILTNVINESLPIKLGLYVDTLIPPVNDKDRIDNKKCSSQQMKSPDDQPHSTSGFNQNKLNRLNKKPSYNCNLCSRIFMERKKLDNHKKYHTNKMENVWNSVQKESKNLENLTNEAQSIKLGVYIDTLIPPVDNTDQSSIQQMEVSTNQPSSTLEYYQKKLVLPEIKSSYKCDICGRVFTKKKTYENHKTNHKYNKNTAKHLFFERGKGKKKSTES